jgi:predicted acetyltransferase
MDLVRPAREYLDSYVDALNQGWTSDSTRPWEIKGDLEQIKAYPQGFVDNQDDRDGQGPPVMLPNGSTAPRLPGYQRWVWDGSFCGLLRVRWQPGTVDLPPYCLGHIGYAVVPWKQKRGYATEALRQALPEVRELGLPYVELVTDFDNVASQRVITANGGVLVEEFVKPDSHFGGAAFRYRISLGT